MQPKRGDINPNTGLVFWQRKCGREVWLTTEKFADRKAKMAILQLDWVENNPGRKLEWERANNAKNPAAHSQRVRRWQIANPEKTRAMYRVWERESYASNPVFKLRKTMRVRIRHALAGVGVSKKSRTFQTIGCTPNELRLHLETQFKPGMTWDNYGPGWHVDHHKPLASATSLAELIALCHFTNLRPLWVLENMRKGAKCLT